MHNTLQPGFTELELLDQVPALRKFASRFYNNRTDIDDLVQDTLAKAIANSDRFESGTNLKSWLFTMMRRHFCTMYVMRKREVVGIKDDAAFTPSMPASQEWTIRGSELEHALADLPRHQRNALLLVYIQGSTYEDAANTCGCAVGTIKSRVYRARQALAYALGEELR